jgi:hypothetical protein
LLTAELTASASVPVAPVQVLTPSPTARTGRLGEATATCQCPQLCAWTLATVALTAFASCGPEASTTTSVESFWEAVPDSLRWAARSPAEASCRLRQAE